MGEKAERNKKRYFVVQATVEGLWTAPAMGMFSAEDEKEAERKLKKEFDLSDDEIIDISTKEISEEEFLREQRKRSAMSYKKSKEDD